MGTWHDYLNEVGAPPEWPYPIKYGEETELEADVLVLGGGIAGCWAAISAARTGAKVIILEKGDVRRSGAGGPGCDHWCNVPANPTSRVDPDEWAIEEMNALGRYSNGIGIQIQCRENWDTLLEMEQMGGKIRDTDDEYLGVEGRDDETKLMVSPRYSAKAGYSPHPDWQKPGFNPPETRFNTTLRVWGSGFKPILKKECLRLGVKILNRVTATSILNENGVRGARAVGATGINDRTGEFVIVKAKTVIISTAGPGQIWNLDMEHGGHSTMYPRTTCGEGTTMAWKAGATLTMMEDTVSSRIATGIKHKWYTGGGDASYENVPIVDANNKHIPFPTQGWADGGAMFSNQADLVAKVRADIGEGKYDLPLYGDFAGMKPEESNATWNLMLTEESTTKVMVQTMTNDGFDINRDQIMSYNYIEFQPHKQLLEPAKSGGPLVDWDLKTTVDGLYVAGTAMFSPEDHSFCAATGRYAGRKAAAYAKGIEQGSISREQIDAEKERVLAPAARTGGIEWKELQNGLCRAMQYFASEWRSESLLKMCLGEIARIEENAVPQLYALDPHKLLRSIEVLSLIDYAKIMLNAMLERKFSEPALGLTRMDYPERDEEESNKYLTLRLDEEGNIVFDKLPIRFWGNMKEQYEAHNPDYTGMYNA